ncbi:DUF58 domain-containing protein [Chloroflexota bacterium]
MNRYWFLIPLVIFIASLIMHQVPLLLISLLLFLAGAVAKLWGRYCLSRVEYHRKLSSDRVFWGEEVQFEVEISNKKILPLFWLQIDDEVPSEVTFLKGNTSPSGNMNRLILNNLLPLSWYHKVTRRYPIKCLHRGVYTFGPVKMASGDLFGFSKKYEDIQDTSSLIVYPRILPLEKLGIPARQPFGDIRLEKHLFQDPVLTTGVRDYTPGDSLKQIHWKSTARRGRLQTKVFEPTTTVDMGVFLDVRTVNPPFWGSIPQLLEMVIITAASVSNYALSNGYRVGLFINQNRWTGRETAIKLAPSQHPEQRLRIMETLAKVHQSDTMPLARLILKEARNLPWGSTIVAITATVTDELMSALHRIKKSGRRVALIIIGDSETGINMDGLTVYRVSDDIPWADMETLNIAKADKEISRIPSVN